MGSIIMELEDIVQYALIHRGINSSSICVSIGMVSSKGIFHGNNPFEYSVPLVLAQLSLACIVVLCTSRLLRPFGFPSMIIQIFSGLILGPSFLGRIAGFTELVYPFKGLVVLDALAVFGYMFYFFLIGVQMDPWILRSIQPKDISIGISTVFLALALSASATFILFHTSFHIEADILTSLPALAISSSALSYPMVAHYLNELKMINSDFGRMALCSSLVSNLFSFCVVTLNIVSQMHAREFLESLETFVAGIFFMLVIAFVARPIIIWALSRYSEGEPLGQSFIFMVLVGVLMMGFCSRALGLSIFFGPLLFGIAIPVGPPLGSALMDKLHLITTWLFLPLYFVKNGLVTDIFSVKSKNYWVVQFVILLACFGKFSGALISSICNKVPLREAVQIGLIMNVQGVLELGMFKMMKQNKAINEEAFIVLCISMIIVTASVTPIARYLYNPLRRNGTSTRTIMDMKPNSELRLVTCIHDQDNVPTIMKLIEILHPTKRSPINICLVHLVDLVGRAHPVLIPHKLNKVNSRCASTSRAIVNAFKILKERYQGIITVHPFTSISPYATMHDEVCEMAISRRASLIITPFHRRLAREGMSESYKPGIKIMNHKILEMASCTVAIVVDRSPPAKVTRRDLEACSLYYVAIFFIGGPDDREGLAIGARMAGLPNINLTIVRVLSNITSGTEESNETKFDNDVINEFRSQMAGNLRVRYREEYVKDATGTVGVIRSIEDQYDIIVVGKYHNLRSPLVLGLSDWREDPELGAVAQMFVLTDSNSKSTIIVVQKCNDIPGGQQESAYDGDKSTGEEPSVPLRRSAG